MTIDGNTGTKWLDFTKSAIVFEFTEPTVVDQYCNSPKVRRGLLAFRRADFWTTSDNFGPPTAFRPPLLDCCPISLSTIESGNWGFLPRCLHFALLSL